MVCFEKGEFEIALMTYNRPNLVKCWMEFSLTKIIERGISLIVYDASPNNYTRDIVLDYKKRYDIKYVEVDNDTTPGYMTMVAITNSLSEYLWVTGDSRLHDFNELDETLFRLIKKGPDYCVIDNFSEKNGRINGYEDLLRETFISCTCTGFSVFKMSIFEEYRNNDKLRQELDCKYRSNYAFAFMGYFYSMYSRCGNVAYICSLKIISPNNGKKKRSWEKRFYNCWIEDLCEIVDNLPKIDLDLKNKIIRDTWKKMNLASVENCYIGRKNYDLEKKYDEYVRKGYIDRITDKNKRLYFFSKKSASIIEFYWKIFQFKCKINYKKNRVEDLIRYIFSQNLKANILNSNATIDYFSCDDRIYDLFFNEYNCGTTVKMRLTERSVELAFAKQWLGEHTYYVEVGTVTPYYNTLYDDHEIIDSSGKHFAVTNKETVFSYDFSGKDVLSISYFTNCYQNNKTDIPEDVLRSVDSIKKILNECKDCLITIPMGCNSTLDRYVMNAIKLDYPNLKVFFLNRGIYNNRWMQSETVENGLKYGPLWANSICIIRKEFTHD